MKSIALLLLIVILSACGQKSSNNKGENNMNVMEQTTKDNQLQGKELQQILLQRFIVTEAVFFAQGGYVGNIQELAKYRFLCLERHSFQRFHIL